MGEEERLAAVITFGYDFVLQNNLVPLLGSVLHLDLKRGAESVKRVVTQSGFLVREQAEPVQSVKDKPLFFLDLKRPPRQDGSVKITY